MSAVNRNLLFRLFIKESPAMSQEGMSRTTMSLAAHRPLRRSDHRTLLGENQCYGENGKTVDGLPGSVMPVDSRLNPRVFRSGEQALDIPAVRVRAKPPIG
jgi:hypothetical protein